MKFAIGDQVVHPVHGVGTIKTFSEQRFVGTQSRQYYEVVTAGSTVWVPVNDSNATVLRGVASPRVVDECRELLGDDPSPLDDNRQLRQVQIAKRMEGGLLPALCQTVRDLRARSLTAPLSAGEDVLLTKLSKALCEEWAAAVGGDSVSALREIEALLRSGRADSGPE